MPEYVGGIRYRLIYDSLYHMLNDALDDLGWFDNVQSRSDVTFPVTPPEPEDAVPYNTLAIVDDNIDDYEFELGSTMGEVSWGMYVDFYAENKPVGIHMINDIRDIMLGRMPIIGRTHPVLEVYDYSLATPTEIFYCDVMDVKVDKANNFPQPYRKNWYSCSFVLVDHYGAQSA